MICGNRSFNWIIFLFAFSVTSGFSQQSAPNVALYSLNVMNTTVSVNSECTSQLIYSYVYNYQFNNSDYSVSHAGDSAGIQNFIKTVPFTNRFQAVAGKVFTFSCSIATFRIPDQPNVPTTSNFTVEGPVVAHIGTLARQRDVGPNPHIDQSVQMDLTETNGYNTYTFSKDIYFDRGTTSGHIIVTVPLKNYTIYDQSTRMIDVILPFVVEGPLDEQVSIIDTTTEPQIPYMVLHDPPGDMSTTTVANGWSNCRTIEEEFEIDESLGAFGKARVGFKGDVGFIYSMELEIFVEFSVDVTEGSYQMQSKLSETCISTSTSVTTSNLPASKQSDLFIGYGVDLAYGVGPNLEIDGCGISLDTGIVYLPIQETIRPFSMTQLQIEQDIIDLQAALPNFTTSEDSANAIYQIDVWQQVLDLNQQNQDNATDYSPPISEIFGGGVVYERTETVEFTDAGSITVNHYLDSQVGLRAGAYIGGNGLEGGVRFTTKKRFGGTTSETNVQSQTISYHLEDDDLDPTGDEFHVDVKRDPMFGTPVFILDEGQSKTSCPYEGGFQRDQPNISGSICGPDGPYMEKIFLDSIDIGPNGEGKVWVKICNDNAQEGRQISWRLDANPQSLGYQLNGSTNQIQDLGFLAPGDCDTFELIVMKINNNLVYNNLNWRVYGTCLTESSSLETFLLQESDVINTNFTFGGIGNYPLGDRDCDGIINAKDCGGMNILTLNQSLGPLSGDYFANQKIIVQPNTMINAGETISWHAPEVEMIEVAVPQTSVLAIDQSGCQ